MINFVNKLKLHEVSRLNPYEEISTRAEPLLVV